MSANVHAILVTAGYQNFRRTRANCPHCHEGHRPPDLTVAIHGDLFYCHRCGRGGHIRQLARVQGINLPSRRQGLARLRKMFFEDWLKKKMTDVSKEEFNLHRKASLAHVALQFPELSDFLPAWEALRRWHERERSFEYFWSLATDKLGRIHLYRYWRKNVADRTSI
jgi:hypothetical protein